jgi:hypothetical protein
MAFKSNENYISKVIEIIDKFVSSFKDMITPEVLSAMSEKDILLLHRSLIAMDEINELALAHAKEEDKKWNELRSALYRIEHKLDKSNKVYLCKS